MKISELIKLLGSLLKKHGDVDVTVSETLWMYNSVKDARYIEKPYYDDSDNGEGVVEITDYKED